MTLGRRSLKRTHSPLKSPRLTNSTLRKRTLIRSLNQEIQFGSASKANLKVVVRVRPENEREIQNNASTVIDIVDDHMLVFDPNHDDDDFFFRGTKQTLRDLNKRQHKEQKFVFENVFGPDSTNEDIYEKTTKDLVVTLLNGYNCSVFAYGATGAGKTFTMLGKPDKPGITFLTVMELYERIKEVEPSRNCEVGVSYLEIYNETVKDLLAPGKSLNLHESGKQVQVTGLSLHKPKDAYGLMQLLADGNRNRSQHPTDSNAESSRSHAVFQVFLRQQDRSPGVVSGISIAKLSMIDLAGSERGAATSFKGARFREGANINKSLLALGNCINALADGKCHIPYRDSKLTRLLKDSLGGNCCSVMIAAISKASTSYEDSFNTLRYAHRAKTIKTTLKKNLINVDQHVSQYLKIVEDLRTEVASLNEKINILKEEATAKPMTEETAQPSIGLTDGDRVMYEETIMSLKLQLESKNTMEDQESSEEKYLLSQFQEMHCQLKAYQRETLQLEANERELKYKIYSYRLQLSRMKVFSSVSAKLDKAIAKAERSVKNFNTRLEHVKKRKVFLSSQLENCRASIRSLCENLKKYGPENESFSESSRNIIETNDLQLSVRDSCQANNFLQGMLRDCLNSQVDNDKLNSLLLYGFKYLYVKLRSVDQSDPETDKLFQNVLSIMDLSRIEWADQKRTEDSFGEEILSQYISPSASIDTEEIINLPLSHPYSFSPILNDFNKTYRRSIMKCSSATASASVKIRHQPLSPVIENTVKLSPRSLCCPSKEGAEERVLSPLYTTEIPESHKKKSVVWGHSPSLDEGKSPQPNCHSMEGAEDSSQLELLEDVELSNLTNTTLSCSIGGFQGGTRVVSSRKEEVRVPLSTLPLQASPHTNNIDPPKILDETFELEPEPEPKNTTLVTVDSTFCVESSSADANGTFCLSSGPGIVTSDPDKALHYSHGMEAPPVFMAPPTVSISSQVLKVGLKQMVPSHTSAKSFKSTRPLLLGHPKGMRKSLSVPSLHNASCFKGPNKTPTPKVSGFGSSLKRTTSYFRMKNLSTKNQENVPPRRGPLFPTSERKFTPKKYNSSSSSLKEAQLCPSSEPRQ